MRKGDNGSEAVCRQMVTMVIKGLKELEMYKAENQADLKSDHSRVVVPEKITLSSNVQACAKSFLLCSYQCSI